ncbi:4Fe-4S dicluster domain-containing protein [Candidatus Viridilinea mediisalina]|uniref:4Fe-4S ferredoxin-type domain-containing protein n=1 Tax=Candidatus Viridilinea mediisalina TaxID=2024553 RepID=A0A2A6RJJ0_9CHLR|nr:4Fe-4S dicluster domain-containing protein [Candidatus Viridilinea mediisalina]PDW03055.1 hypothetical protein CJ255_10740 [Candidatus Viridilinea mediisalina]
MSSLIEQQLRERATALLDAGSIDLFLGYRQGSRALRVAPFAARSSSEAERLVWNAVCVPNLAGALHKYADQRVGIALKMCDARSVIELLRFNQVKRENLHVIGVVCHGMADPELVEVGDETPIAWWDPASERPTVGPERLLEKCASCPKPVPDLYDELLGTVVSAPAAVEDARITDVRKLEAMDAPTRRAFWQAQLSNCTLCYACQTVCPLCFCKRCALSLERDDPRRQARDMGSIFTFHMMRAYHLAERCTGCDECERVCPEDIPLSLITEKLELDRGQQ